MGNKGEAAKLLKALRERSGLSVAAIAEKAGMPKSTYQHYEDGYKKRYLPPDMAEKFRRALIESGIDPNEAAKLCTLSTGKDYGLETIPDYPDSVEDNWGDLMEDEELWLAIEVLADRTAEVRRAAYRVAIDLARKKASAARNP